MLPGPEGTPASPAVACFPSQGVPVRSRSRRHHAPAEAPALRTADAPGRKTFAPRAVPPPLIERIERALVLAAYVVVKHGPVYAPLLDRLETELQAARRNDPTELARRILKDYEGDRAPNRPGTRSGRRTRRPRSRRAARRRKSGHRRKKPAPPASMSSGPRPSWASGRRCASATCA